MPNANYALSFTAGTRIPGNNEYPVCAQDDVYNGVPGIYTSSFNMMCPWWNGAGLGGFADYYNLSAIVVY